ncbi:MAG: carboxypeptidase regulatory-like domain-containing protein [candidate division Zixibacteria bacterium]|nr:carboxypeptidase regulatory-like domain-containing protein [candidate division Zixibacteria bacterium]
MKLILLITALLIFPIILSAQEPDVYIMVGSPGGDADTITVGIYNDCQIPVYYQAAGENTIYGGFHVYALGINNAYIDEFDTAACTYHYPFTQWDYTGFLNFDRWAYSDDDGNRWSSYSFESMIYVHVPDDPNPWLILEPGAPPIHGITFACHSAYRPGLADSVISNAIGPGEDRLYDSSTLRDTTDLVTYEIDESYANIKFEISVGFNSIIAGTVYDENMNPIAGAYVKELKSQVDDTTDINGQYTLANLYPGYGNLVFEADGYQRLTRNNVYVRNNDTTVVDIQMCWIEMEPDFDIMIWIGGQTNDCRWIDTVSVYRGLQLEIPVYFLCQDYVSAGDISFPLAINNAYLDSFITEDCRIHYPFSWWDSKSFGSLNEDYLIDSTGSTWDSYSFTGFAELFPPYDSPMLNTLPGDPPVHGLTYVVEVAYYGNLNDLITSNAIGPGLDPISGPANIGDEWGGQGYNFIQYFSLFRFINTQYTPGDANMYNGQWPPSVIGGDVTYLANYFRSAPASHPCMLEGLWASADVNGDCLVIGSDVTRIVNYFKGNIGLTYCPDHPPTWPTPADIPSEAPEGWPNCE